METIAIDSTGAHAAARTSISLHPAFPAVVALWFSCLFGLGSMVLPVALLERVVGATGIVALVPGTAPPYGVAARGLIAAAMAIAGALLGMVIARRVARAHAGNRQVHDGGRAMGARRPIRGNEELCGDGLVEGAESPLWPGRAWVIAKGDRWGELRHVASLFDDNLATAAAAQFAGDDPVPSVRALHSPPEPQATPEQHDGPPPLQFSAPSLARRVRAEGGLPTCQMPSPEAVGEAGLAQLIQRLGDSIGRRRESPECPIHGPPLLAASGVDPARAEEAAQAMAASFARPAAVARAWSTRAANGPAGAMPAVGLLADRDETDAALRAALMTLQRMNRTA